MGSIIIEKPNHKFLINILELKASYTKTEIKAGFSRNKMIDADKYSIINHPLKWKKKPLRIFQNYL